MRNPPSIRKACALGLIALPALLLCPFSAGAAEVAGTEVELAVEEGRLSMDLGQPVPLRDLLEAIGAEAGVAVQVSGDLGLIQPRVIEARPLAEAIGQLAREHNLLMVFGTGGGHGPEELSKVVVYAAAPPDERAAARAAAQALERRQSPPAAGSSLSNEAGSSIRQLDQEGLSPEQISEAVDVPLDQVRRYLQDFRSGG